MTNVNQMVEFLLNENEELNEGFLRASAGAIGSIGKSMNDEVKGWTKNEKEKAQQISDNCDGIIDWLKEKDKEYPNLNLDMGAFYTWMKTSETFNWRYYFILNDGTFNSIIKSIKSGNTSEIEGMANFDFSDRKQATQILDKAKNIKGLIEIVDRYKKRSNELYNAFVARNTKIKGAPLQVALLGSSELSMACKKIVNLAI
jgi:hypothetical protein